MTERAVVERRCAPFPAAWEDRGHARHDGPPDAHLLESEPRPSCCGRSRGERRSETSGTSTDDRLRSVERIHLVNAGGSVVVAFWPAELKNQALYLYDRDGPPRWSRPGARRAGRSRAGRSPSRNSAPALRLYLQPIAAAAEVDRYVERFSAADRGRIGAHAAGGLKDGLWRWLKQAGYVADGDDPVLRQYLDVLGRRDVFFRAALRSTQRWGGGRPERELAAAIRSALDAPLRAAGEPALPL